MTKSFVKLAARAERLGYELRRFNSTDTRRHDTLCRYYVSRACIIMQALENLTEVQHWIEGRELTAAMSAMAAATAAKRAVQS